jgi:hypothetical protein
MLRASGVAMVGKMSPGQTRAVCGMSARSGVTMLCIDIQDALAIVPWMPMMAGTLAT